MIALRQHWRSVLGGGALLVVLALVRAVSDAPVQFGVVRVDALTAFFGFATLAALALTVFNGGASRGLWLRAALLLVAYAVTLTPVVALLIVAAVRGQGSEVRGQGSRIAGQRLLIRTARHMFNVAPQYIAAASLFVGYGALALGGALRYDDRAAGAALNSFIFWFVLLAALVPLTPIDDFFSRSPLTPSPLHPFTFAWFYPLARLYSLGPWNTGWSYAVLLLGGGVALWSASSALITVKGDVRMARICASLAALALAGFGMGTGAGIAAGCYGVLALLMLQTQQTGKLANKIGGKLVSAFVRLPVHQFMPFVAPFVAVWMLIGAATAGGAQVFAGVVWLVALLCALALIVGDAPRDGSRVSPLKAVVSLALAVGAPLVMLVLIEPVIAQLQGGLTPYGDVVIWPWVGLAVRNSANTPVAALPSVAVAALMLVLVAIVYLLARLRESFAAPADEPPPDSVPVDSPRRAAILRVLRDEVPWLNLFLPNERNGARRVDGE